MYFTNASLHRTRGIDKTYQAVHLLILRSGISEHILFLFVPTAALGADHLSILLVVV